VLLLLLLSISIEIHPVIPIGKILLISRVAAAATVICQIVVAIIQQGHIQK